MAAGIAHAHGLSGGGSVTGGLPKRIGRTVVPTHAPKRGDRATAPIEDIWCEKIRGCSYRGGAQRKDAIGPCVDIWVAARWAERLIYLKTASETRAQLTFAR